MVLERDDSNEQAWLWFASVVDTVRERRICLENVLEINPNNQRARQALEKLQTPLSDTLARHAPQQIEGEEDAPAPKATAKPLTKKPLPGERIARPVGEARRRRRRPLFIMVAVLAVLLMGLGLLLVSMGGPADTGPTLAPAANTSVAQATSGGRATTTSSIAIITGVPPTAAPSGPSWTPAPTITLQPTPTPTATLPPLAGYTLLFIGEGRGSQATAAIYTVKAQGGSEQLVLGGEAPVRDVAVSSTGALAYVTVQGGKPQVAVADADGKNPKVITKLGGDYAGTPAWSPDGKKLAFVANDPGNNELFIADPDGGNLVRLTDNKVEDRDPAWSPDGKQIAYASDPTGNKSLQLFVIDVASKKFSQLGPTTPKDTYSPVWSPDGKFIAVVSTRDRFEDVYVVNIATPTDIRIVTYGDGDAISRNPDWSPDGKYIVFASNRPSGDNYNLFIATPDGKNVQQITKTGSSYAARFKR
jgi:Tol biopolymer transport system component